MSKRRRQLVRELGHLRNQERMPNDPKLSRRLKRQGRQIEEALRQENRRGKKGR